MDNVIRPRQFDLEALAADLDELGAEMLKALQEVKADIALRGMTDTHRKQLARIRQLTASRVEKMRAEPLNDVGRRQLAVMEEIERECTP